MVAIFNMTEKKCVCVMSGSFSPPTFAHLHILTLAKAHLEENGYTVVKGLFLPTNSQYPKPGLAPAPDRVEMCKLLSKEDEWVDVDPFDTLQPKWVDLLTSLRHIQGDYPDCRIFFVCGADLVLRWNEAVWPPDEVRTILDDFGVCMASRTDAIESIVSRVPVLENHLQNVFMIPDNLLNEVSSTHVREFIAKGRSTAGLIPKAIRDYLISKHLLGFK